jgi:two-component system, chemotaxis family, CheB/CheR fusion protein
MENTVPEITQDTATVRSENLFPVVGIGASAGGLETFKRLLKAIPENSGMAFILVQHLAPSHESILPELLQKVTKLPVLEITDNIRVVPDHIYIIPSNKLLVATDGVLRLKARPKIQKNMPIDLFFSSLAEVHQSHAIGVVLSGTGSDGTLGLKAIKDHGGITFAQDQESAAYDAMPQSAIDAEVVDFILSPEEIPGQLLLLVNAIENDSTLEKAGKKQEQEEGLKQILSVLRKTRGIDFTYYKQSTIQRRISRRIALSMKGSITNYLAFFKENKAEQDILYQDLLIPVTQFFRDPKVYEDIIATVFPVFLQNLQGNEPFRFWIPGCSTGEEAYSMVICLQEFLAEKSLDVKLQVFATDISEIAIAKARSGIYKKKEMNDLTPEQVQEYFVPSNGGFQVKKSIRDKCVFAYHNYLKDPPFANLDLVSCRNSLIYMEPFLQRKALTTFHYALKQTGFLVLGKSETAAQATELFSVFNKNSKIYSRKAVRGNFMHMVSERKNNKFKNSIFGPGQNEIIRDDFQKNADEILLSKYAPSGVVVDGEFEIVQYRGATGNWLEPSPGKPNQQVLKMAREGLAFELRNALHKAKDSNETSIKEDIPIVVMGIEQLVTIEVIPLARIPEPHYLILFKDTTKSPKKITPAVEKNKITDLSDSRHKTDNEQIHELRKELVRAREDMRSITEEQEAANEELQSANEELLSGSEELQSLNEELEASKEETQTSNEELIIVNQELYDKNEQLNLSRLYSESIVTTIRESLLILNKKLQVRSANKSFYTIFQTSEEETEGKLIFELGDHQWDIPELRKILDKILTERTSFVDFEVTAIFSRIGERTMLLNASQIFRDSSEEELILLAIEDITEKRRTDQALKLFSEELEMQVLERTSSLNEANLDLLHSNKNLEQFAYVASHDLQEPLRKIRIYSTLLKEKYHKDISAGAEELISKITSSSERMSTLIKELLDFSIILHGEADFVKTDMNDILKKNIDDFELLIAEKNAIVTHDQLPVIEAIPLQINQLFYNLISNSLKFSRKDSVPAISITSKILKTEEIEEFQNLNKQLTYCEISFQDNGIGFDQQYADQIFLIFKRLHGREKFSGTGIGLALCKTIAINHHGEIVASSTKNEGALFRIVLPLKQEKITKT